MWVRNHKGDLLNVAMMDMIHKVEQSVAEDVYYAVVGEREACRYMLGVFKVKEDCDAFYARLVGHLDVLERIDEAKP